MHVLVAVAAGAGSARDVEQLPYPISHKENAMMTWLRRTLGRHYRGLYMGALALNADLVQLWRREMATTARVRKQRDDLGRELVHIQSVLAPWGLKVLEGQTQEGGDERQFIMLPELEYEMAKAYLQVNANFSGSAALGWGDLSYSWRGRRILLKKGDAQ
jgi:hypothetical protein